MATDDDREMARVRVQQAHEHVAAGRYRDAMRAFAEGVVGLRDALGEEHPETREAMADLQTVQEMAGVADFLDTHKLRMPGDLPDLPELPDPTGQGGS